MFGYVKTDIQNMFVKDVVLYKAMYCGLCKSIGKSCGQRGRLVLSYDLTFLSLILHNLLNKDVKIEKQRCVLHRIKKRPVTVSDEISETVADLNVILAYHKLNDDVIDENKGKLKRAIIKKAYKRAKIKEPELDKIVSKKYDELLNLEKKNCDSIDMVADPFGSMMQEIFSKLLKDEKTEETETLSYLLGKWIYLIDALDDFDKDKKKNTFNVFINSYKEIDTKVRLLKEKRREIEEIFYPILNEIGYLSTKLNYKFNHDLIDNILTRGLVEQTKNVMENKVCKSIIKY